jgi:RNA polymerase sigma-70 factor (ECF subfamily)
MDLDIEIDAIVAGDTAAFGRWLALAETPLRDSLRSFASVVDVESVLQEAMVRIWQVAPRFERDGRDNGLLRLGVRIARNLAISEVRRRKSTEPSDDDLVAPEVTAPDPMLRRAIVDCRDKLPNKPREALDARLAGGDDDELAAALNMKLNTFLQNITRARKLLADCLRNKGVPIEELA